MSIGRAFGDRRHKLHDGQASSRPLSDDYETKGVMGELALSELTGLAPDLTDRIAGDGGKDGRIYLGYTVDVKCAEKPYNLIHEVGKKFADIFILARYNGPDEPAELLGWHWGKALKRAPTREFGHGILNHYIPVDKLKPIEELRERVLRIS